MSATETLWDHRLKLIGAALLIAAIVAPLVTTGYYVQVLLRLALFLGLVASWNFIGYTGYINFGQVAFYGVGAYLMGISASLLGIPFWPSVIIGGIAAAMLAGILGAITLKLSGHYFSIASLLLLIIVDVIFTNLSDLRPILGISGLREEVIPPAPTIFPGMDVTVSFYYLLLGLAVAHVLFSIWLERSRFGYGMKAIAQDEAVAEGLGVPTLRLKLLAIVLSGLGAGLVGAVYGAYTGYIDTQSFFGLTLTFLIVFVGMIGSLGRWYGPVVGVLLFIPADEILSSAVSPELGRIVFGALFIVIMLQLPRGLGYSIMQRLRGEEPVPTPGEGESGEVAT
ncbi:MAG: branched-chain amino acid ABC transporter permease, partial [Natronomonas sp.]|uniref:branched-chain amino acid ABC transporter permease n=1 Tax=Natronomonas sp. TaxID=2184060 RepID=UPI002870AD50